MICFTNSHRDFFRFRENNMKPHLWRNWAKSQWSLPEFVSTQTEDAGILLRVLTFHRGQDRIFYLEIGDRYYNSPVFLLLFWILACGSAGFRVCDSQIKYFKASRRQNYSISSSLNLESFPWEVRNCILSVNPCVSDDRNTFLFMFIKEK